MKNTRILPYNLSKILTTEEISSISATGTTQTTLMATSDINGRTDVAYDFSQD